MSFINPFQSGQQFAVDLARRQAELEAYQDRQQAIGELAEQFGPQAYAPNVYSTLRGDVRAERRLESDLQQRQFSNRLLLQGEQRAIAQEQRRATEFDVEMENQARQRQMAAARNVVSFYRAGLASGASAEEITQRAAPALEALGVAPEQYGPLVDAITTDPTVLDQMQAAIIAAARPRRASGNPIAIIDAQGQPALMQSYTDGSYEILPDLQPAQTVLANQRIIQAQERITQAEPATQAQIQFARRAGTEAATELNAGSEAASTARAAVEASDRQLELLDQGIITGFAAPVRLEIARGVQFLTGREIPSIGRTDQFVGEAGRAVAEYITNLGAGTGLSDADRNFALQVVGGQINVDENALRRLVTIVRDTSARSIRSYNQRRATILQDQPESTRRFAPPPVGGQEFAPPIDDQPVKRYIYNPETGQIERQ